ncbi:MAG: cytochrome b [Alphaproteobacteria bacterium]
MYHPISKLFHWTIGLLMIGLLFVGLTWEDFFPEPFRFTLLGWHKSLGAIVLGLSVLRALWWLTQTKPALVKTLPARMAPFINLGHNILYAFMMIMPLSGWMMSNAAGYPVSVFGWFTLPTLLEKNDELRHTFGEVHELAGWTLIAIIAFHVAAALYHHVVLKDETLKRMMFRG